MCRYDSEEERDVEWRHIAATPDHPATATKDERVAAMESLRTRVALALTDLRMAVRRRLGTRGQGVAKTSLTGASFGAATTGCGRVPVCQTGAVCCTPRTVVVAPGLTPTMPMAGHQDRAVLPGGVSGGRNACGGSDGGVFTHHRPGPLPAVHSRAACLGPPDTRPPPWVAQRVRGWMQSMPSS